VTAALAEITTQELWEKMERGEPFVLVDALAPIAFAAARLPGAINIPPPSVDGVHERRIPERDAEVVVYCANPSCESSVDVATRLVELGYTNVRHYPGGKQEWRDAGLPLEGGRIEPPTAS
jgi:rhodanese-related sulfurtransferase